MAFDAQRSAPALERVVAIGDTPDDRGPSWTSWLQTGGDVSEAILHRRSAEVTPADLAQIQFTSGTTGFPKGAALPHLGLVNNPRLMAHRAGWGFGTRLCSALPFFHTGGSVQSTLGMVGTGGTFMPMLTFDPRRMVDTIGAERVEAVLAVPTMLFGLERELDAGGGTFDSLRTVIVGGAPVPQDLCLRWQERFGVRFSIVYGLTEASPVITQSLPSDPIDRQVGTCGCALDHVEWDVADSSTSRPVPLGEHGEVRVRGWSVMHGYHGDADATAAALTCDGWLRTGDLGTMDADGYLRITGRAKEMVIRGGENIYPAEIEAALRDLEGVAEAYVVGVPDDHYGEVCAAFVRLRSGAELTEEAMEQQLSQRVARYKVPQYLRVVEEFPLTASGKVRKFKLQEQFLQTLV